MTQQIELQAGGFTPMTTLDYPGELSAVIFCQGCPWQCRYCHNEELIPRQGKTHISWQQIIEFLRQRRGLLDAVVFSGGEPTLQKALPAAISEIKSLDYKIGLHTAGPYPERLKEILPYLDWVGLDIKAMEENYAKVTEVKGSGQKAWESARILIESGIPHEIRTTIHPGLTSTSEQAAITQRLNSFGPTRHRLQPCVTEHCLDPLLRS